MNIRKNRGITLIALVITIVILVILAGVSINLLIGENGIFNITEEAKEKTNKSAAMELLGIKIYDYQIYEASQNKNVTLEGFKKYIENDKEIEYMQLYINKGTLEPIQNGEIATHAKIKLTQYSYEFTLNANLNIIQIDGKTIVEQTPITPKVEIDLELEALLKEANMTITLEDILNTSGIMEHVKGLIPVLTESDVTRSEEAGIIIYKDNKGGTIRTNSENSNTDGNCAAWRPFGNFSGNNDYALSDKGDAKDYYLEYEFKDRVYATQIKYIFNNGASAEGTRIFVIQGYNEEENKWEDLTNDITWIGNINSLKEEIQNLNYEKACKRYRLYVKEATYTSHTNGAVMSGLTKMQLYGVLSSSVEANSEENLKQALLLNANIKKITLGQMTTNKEFMKRLLDALSIETVKNNPNLINNLYALIPVLTESDVTRSEEGGVVIYKDNKGGTIRTSSEYVTDYAAWKAFGNVSENNYALSDIGDAKDYYLEYEFKDKVYATQIKYTFSNSSSQEGKRVIVIQGYDEEENKWEDLSSDITWIGNANNTKEDIQNLNYEKAYKRYRLYVKDVYVYNEHGWEMSGLMQMQLYGKKQ